jgi:hypothetical protein
MTWTIAGMETWKWVAEWPYIDIVVVAYPSAHKLNLDTKQNSFHTPIPTLAPKYVLPLLWFAWLVSQHTLALVGEDLPLEKYVVTAWDLCIYPAFRRKICARISLEGSHQIVLVMNVLLYDRILVFMTNDPWHPIAICSSSVFWLLRLRNQRLYVTASARTCQSWIFIIDGPTNIPSRNMAINATIEQKARADYSMFAHDAGESTVPALVGGAELEGAINTVF